ncbi:MAG: anti-sigma factor [Acidobacteriota bacterium]|nr:anti-sigma factor [Acidobacteriota bacterium]
MSETKMTCAEVDILLCDYVDGELRGVQKSALEDHLAGCSGCAEIARDVQAAVTFIGRAAVAEPPAELLTRILHEIPAGKQNPAWRRLAGRWFGGWFESILQPRYAMGMAMTVLSFSMLAKFAGIQPRQLSPADLNPVKIWMSVDDRAHRGWDRAMKSYENLRWVIEIQSRLKEWSEQDQEQAQKNQPPSK